ncbi:hypothetical protein F5Y04DRAFT_289447 [Hypomontagnella monticulosa]|nr:hypothetical protein F5Y04DRAFT_289447 [Hypomontagnella monticulosa]
METPQQPDAQQLAPLDEGLIKLQYGISPEFEAGSSMDTMALQYWGEYILPQEGDSQSHPTNAPQGFLVSCSPQPPQVVLTQRPKPQENQAAQAAQAAQEPKKSETQDNKENPSSPCTLDDFWYTSGADWSQVELDNEDPSWSTEGVESMETGPECFTCGTRLGMDEINGLEPCPVCFCYN